jgi:hypothetical protein
MCHSARASAMLIGDMLIGDRLFLELNSLHYPGDTLILSVPGIVDGKLETGPF